MGINPTAIPEMHDCDIIQPLRRFSGKAGGGVSKVAMSPERGWVYMGLAGTLTPTKCPGAPTEPKTRPPGTQLQDDHDCHILPT